MPAVHGRTQVLCRSDQIRNAASGRMPIFTLGGQRERLFCSGRRLVPKRGGHGKPLTTRLPNASVL